MPLVRENSQLYEVIKVGTVSGVPLLVSGVIATSGTTSVTGTVSVSGTTSVTGTVSISGVTPSSGSIPVSDNSSSLTVDGRAYRITTTITRPSNTTAYTANDVVGDTGGSAIITLSGFGPSGGFVLIQSMSLVFSDSVVPAGMGAFRVHFYSASPTAIADNAPFDLVSGDRANYMGYVELPTPQDLGSTLYTQIDYPGRLVKLAAANTTCYAEIETRGAYTPVSASTVTLRVNTLESSL